MSEQWMNWKTIETAPTDNQQILVGFMGQSKWFSFVAYARGKDTNAPGYAKPTHWTTIIPPVS